jgi:hypothetical protein
LGHLYRECGYVVGSAPSHFFSEKLGYPTEICRKGCGRGFFALTGAGNGECHAEQTEAVRLQARAAHVADTCPKRVPSGTSTEPSQTLMGPPDPEKVEEAMQFFDRSGEAPARRRARGKRVRRQLLVVLTALMCFGILRLCDRDLKVGDWLSIKLSLSAEVACGCCCFKLFALTGAGNGECHAEQTEAVRLQARAAHVADTCPKRVPSGTSPNLSAGVLIQQA